MQLLETLPLEVEGGTIPVQLFEDAAEDGKKTIYKIGVDDVIWMSTESKFHATILFNMLHEHIKQYMHYKKTR